MKKWNLILGTLAVAGLLSAMSALAEQETVYEFGASPFEGDTPGYARDDGTPKSDPADSYKEGRGAGGQEEDPADEE